MIKSCNNCKHRERKKWGTISCEHPRSTMIFAENEWSHGNCKKGRNWVGNTAELVREGRPWWFKLIKD